MTPAVDLVTLAGVVALGLVHGAEPGHGWPIAAAYALETSRKWFYGLLAGLVIGLGHLVSSLAVVGVFFLAKSHLGIAEFPWLNEVAGLLLVLLGTHEYRNGHSHTHSGGHGEDDEHSRADTHVHDTDHSHDPVTGIRDGGIHGLDCDHGDDNGQPPPHEEGRGHSHNAGHTHSHDGDHSQHDGHQDHSPGHDHADLEAAADRGLWGLASAAFVLGFAHEEEFEIIGICAGTDACLSLMVAYALAVVASLVALTLLLVAGYYRYQERVERIAPHFSTISAVVLVAMGILFIVGVL